MHKNTTFCILTLYPVTFQNSFIRSNIFFGAVFGFSIYSMSSANTYSFFFSFFFWFLIFRATPWHMEVPRLGVELELQLPAYATATSMRDPSHVCNIHHSSWQHWIPDPLSEARDRTHILRDTSRINFLCITMGTPK